MLRTRVMPCLLLDDGRLVKTIKFKNPSYVGDPVNAIKIYNEKEVDELILLDITATVQERRPPFEVIEEVASECFMPMAYGGGIRTLDDIQRIYAIGLEKVIINSYAAEEPSFIDRAAERFGSQSIVVSIDVKKSLFGSYGVFTRSGTLALKKNPVEYARELESRGVGEIIVNSIDRDGTYNGYDIDLIRSIAETVTIPVVALGGASGINDIADVVKQGKASAAAAGSLFVYQKKGMGVLINFPDPTDLERVLT